MKVCGNCGKELSVLEGAKLYNDIVCDECCESIIQRNGSLSVKLVEFQKNLYIVSLDEFKKMYENPNLAAMMDTKECLLVSPFRKELAKEELRFSKKQLWVSYVKKKIETTVLLFDNAIDVTEVIMTVKNQVKNYCLSIENIQICECKLKMHKFPLVLIILLLIFYRIDIWSILLTALLLLWSYGNEIVIKTKQGDTYKIPVNSKTADVDVLLTYIREAQQNSNINTVKELSRNNSKEFCSSCGTKMSGNEKFCKNCGAKVE